MIRRAPVFWLILGLGLSAFTAPEVRAFDVKAEIDKLCGDRWPNDFDARNNCILRELKALQVLQQVGKFDQPGTPQNDAVVLCLAKTQDGDVSQYTLALDCTLSEFQAMLEIEVMRQDFVQGSPQSRILDDCYETSQISGLRQHTKAAHCLREGLRAAGLPVE